jgi:anthranilate phosphoribosyltransferase
MVVHGADGLDEITISAETKVTELRDGRIRTYTITPEELGLDRSPLSALRVSSPSEGAAALQEVLSGRKGPRRDIVIANAAAAAVVAGLADELPDGIALAARSIDSGKAAEALARLVEISNLR